MCIRDRNKINSVAPSFGEEEERLRTTTSFNEFTKSFIKGKSNPECQNITISKELTCDHQIYVVSDEAVDKLSLIHI